MSRSWTFPRRLLVAAAAASLAMVGVASLPASAAPPPSEPTPAQAAPTAAKGAISAGAKLAGRLASVKGGTTAVFVQFAGDGAADASAAAVAGGKGAAGGRSAAKAARAAARSTASAVVGQARGKDAKVRELFQVGNAIPGVAMTADKAAIDAVAARADVVKISPLVPKHFQNSNGEELTNVLKTWQDTGTLGTGVRVGIIDTGLDYTHADFGGPGTVAAYTAAETHASDLTYDWHGALPALAQTKIADGWDFVGDNYNADPSATDYQPVAHPDPNPLDCNEHGTHVAGITAGYGVNGDGSTFIGSYPSLTSTTLNAMKIGPGMAPAATIYPLKVFGCTGSTDAVIPALDRALDPNSDGDFSDHLDIVNLSLGSDYGAVDDPENAVVDNLAKHGVLPVIAMGNNGDLTDTGGSPGNAVRSLAVASSVDNYQPLNQLTVNGPENVAGAADGQVSQAYDWAGKPSVTGDVVALSAADADGCAALGAGDAAAVAGKIAWLIWDSNDSSRRCGSAGRAANVAAAGAIGAIFTGDVNPFASGISGSATIPVFQLTPSSTSKLAPYVGAGLSVTFDSSTANLIGVVDDSITDLISSFSSRGTHGSIGVVKPDVAAPGDTIVSAGMGLGSGALSLSGTSMATPHTAGIAALVKSVHPSWTAEQVKAAIMNTAGHDLYSQPNQTGPIYGPARVGAGRVDALAAVTNPILAYAADVRGGVSASFGVVEAPANRPTVTKVQAVTVQNTGSKSATLTLSYQGDVSQPGVSYQVRPATLTLGAGKSTTVRVTMTVRTKELRNTIDPTMAVDQLGVPRQFVADASGRLLIAVKGASNAAPLRVPVYGAAKPTSQTFAFDNPFSWLGKKFASVQLAGRGVEQGSGPTAYTSLASVLTLGATSGKLPRCSGTVTTNCTINQTAAAGDLQYVGAGAVPDSSGSKANGWLWFGISTYGDWATVGNTTVPYVDIDVDSDGTPDFEVYVQNASGTDVLLASLVNLKTLKVIDREPVNMNWADVNTNVFDTNVLLIPVWPAAIGITDTTTSFPITYSVGTNSAYAVNANGDIDDVGPVSFDAAKPAVQVDSALYLDQGRTAIPYSLSRPAAPPCHGWFCAFLPKPAVNALVLHLHGASGDRAQVVPLRG